MKTTHKWLSAGGAVLMGLAASAAVYAAPIGSAVTGDDHETLLTVATAAGSGRLAADNGAAGQAAFRRPDAVLPLPDGGVLVADAKNNAIREIKNGEVTTFAGYISAQTDANGNPLGALLDGPAATAVFDQPMGLARDGQGNIYVADAGNNAIRRIDKAGNVTTVAGDGTAGAADGRGSAARFNHPEAVAAAKDGTLYVADTLNHLVRRIAPDGQVTTLNAASTREVNLAQGHTVPAGDYRDGALSTALFNEPSGLALDDKGNLYVSDSGNQVIRYVDFATGRVSTVAGHPPRQADGSLYAAGALYAAGGYADGPAADAQFNAPKGLFWSADNGLWIADSGNNSVRYLKDGAVRTIAGDPTQANGFRDGVDRYAQLNAPQDIAEDADGNLWIADAYNYKVREAVFYRLPAGLANTGSIQWIVGDKPVAMSEPIAVAEGRAQVEWREFASATGAETANDQTTYTLTYPTRQVKFTLGQLPIEVYQDGQLIQTIQSDTAPVERQGKVYVPVRSMGEAAGDKVDWLPKLRAVLMRPMTGK